MKNQYFGDIGDYSKFILMTQLLKSGLKVGLNWYLTKNDGKTDGKHIDYLNKPEYYNSDPELCDFIIRALESDRRNIAETRKLDRFKNISFYEELLDLEDLTARTAEGRLARIERRKQWFNMSFKELSDSDVIFCDPDNGIATKSVRPSAKNSVKYVFTSEIEQMIDNGYSLVIYNHRDRSKEADYKARIKNSYNGNKEIQTRIIRFNKYSVRDYIFLIQDKHKNTLDTFLDDFIKDNRWVICFKEIDNKW